MKKYGIAKLANVFSAFKILSITFLQFLFSLPIYLLVIIYIFHQDCKLNPNPLK